MRDHGIGSAGMGLKDHGHGSEGSQAQIQGIAGRSNLIRKFCLRLCKSF